MHSAEDGEDPTSRWESFVLCEIRKNTLRTALGRFVVEFKKMFTAAGWNVGHPEDDSRWFFIVAKAARAAAPGYYPTDTQQHFFKSQMDNDLTNRIFFEEVENLTRFVIDQTAQLLLKETADEKAREEKATQQLEFVAKIKELFFPKYIDLVKKEITDHGPFRPTHRDHGRAIHFYFRDDVMPRANFWFWCTYPFVVRLLRCVSPSDIPMVLQPPAKEAQAAVLETIVKEQPSIMEGGMDCALIQREWFLAWESFLSPNSQQQQLSPPSANNVAVVPFRQREYSCMDAPSTEPDIDNKLDVKAKPAGAPAPATAPSLFTAYYSYDTEITCETRCLNVKDWSFMYVSPAMFDTLWLWFGGCPMLSCRVDPAYKLPVFRKAVKVAFGDAQTSPRITVFIWPTMTAKSVLDLAFSMAPPEALALWKGVDRITLVKKAKYQHNEDDFLDLLSSVQPFIELCDETNFIVTKALAPLSGSDIPEGVGEEGQDGPKPTAFKPSETPPTGPKAAAPLRISELVHNEPAARPHRHALECVVTFLTKWEWGYARRASKALCEAVRAASLEDLLRTKVQWQREDTTTAEQFVVIAGRISRADPQFEAQVAWSGGLALLYEDLQLRFQHAAVIGLSAQLTAIRPFPFASGSIVKTMCVVTANDFSFPTVDSVTLGLRNPRDLVCTLSYDSSPCPILCLKEETAEKFANVLRGIPLLSLPSISSIPPNVFCQKNVGAVFLTNLPLLESIADDAFSGCTHLSNIVLSQLPSLRSIGNHAYEKCSSLQSISLADLPLLERIGDDAFKGCKYLSNVVLSQLPSLPSIGNRAFADCESLRSITLADLPTPQEYHRRCFQWAHGSRVVSPEPQQDHYQTCKSSTPPVYWRPCFHVVYACLPGGPLTAPCPPQYRRQRLLRVLIASVRLFREPASREYWRPCFLWMYISLQGGILATSFPPHYREVCLP